MVLAAKGIGDEHRAVVHRARSLAFYTAPCRIPWSAKDLLHEAGFQF